MESKNLNFCKFRIPKNTGRVIWEITNACNYGCSYCIFSSTGRKAENELSLDKIKETLLQLKKLNFNYIKYTGGEPFLREDMIDILLYTKEIGMECDISTNASFFTEDLVEKLTKIDLEMLHISLDGFNKESHEIVRGKKTFEPTIKGINLLKDKNKYIRIGYVIHEHNENNLKDIVELCENLNASEVIFSLMEPVGRMKESSKFLAKKSIQQLRSELDLIKNNYKIKVNYNLPINENSVVIHESINKNSLNDNTCPGGTQFLFINSSGDVSPCTWITEKSPQFILGSLYNNSLNEILNSDKFNMFSNTIKNYKNICPADNIKNVHSVQFSNNSKVYAFSTENLEYLKQIDLKDKKILTIGGSLDQNLVCELLNAKEVLNIDINENAYQYAQLKWGALKVLSYKEYLDFFMRGDNSFNRRSYRKIQPLLTTECDFYFQTLFNTYKKGTLIREGHLFNNLNDDINSKIFNSYYLRNENDFLTVKNKILDKKLNWKITNILSFNSNEKFDVILLSNIADYSHKMFLGENHLQEFKQKVVLKYQQLLSSNGLIMFSYIFDYDNKNNSDKRNPINNQKIRYDLYSDDINYKYDEIILKSAINGDYRDSACLLGKN